MMGYTGTSGVRRKEWTAVGSSAKVISRNLSALANRHRAHEAGVSSTNRPRCNGVSTKGGTETEKSTGGDPMIETATDDWIPEMGKLWEGTKGDTPGA